MKLIKNQNKTWQDNPGYSKKILLTDQDINIPGFRIQEIINPPHSRVDNHYHQQQTEIFYFLNSVGRFYVNEKLINIGKGDLLIVEPGDMHYTINDSDQDFSYICYKVNFEEGDTLWEN